MSDAERAARHIIDQLLYRPVKARHIYWILPKGTQLVLIKEYKHHLRVRPVFKGNGRTGSAVRFHLNRLWGDKTILMEI